MKQMSRFLPFFLIILLGVSSLRGALIESRVVQVDGEMRSYEVEIMESEDAQLAVGSRQVLRVGPGDAGIDYVGRRIRGRPISTVISGISRRSSIEGPAPRQWRMRIVDFARKRLFSPEGSLFVKVITCRVCHDRPGGSFCTNP